MKILTDENIEQPIIDWLRENGYDVLSITEEHRSLTDDAVLDIAISDQRVLITNDKDFGELIFRRGSTSVGVILIRASDEHSLNKLSLLQKLFSSEKPEQIEQSFIILNEQGVRIRKLPAWD